MKTIGYAIFATILLFILGNIYISQKNINSLSKANKLIANEVKITFTPAPMPFVDQIILFDLVQTYRTSHGLSAYIKSEFLCDIARTRLPEVKTNWSHEGFTAARFCNDSCWMGENLAKYEGNAQNTLNAWLNSPGHKEALDHNYTHSCLISDGIYTVEEFGYY